MPDVDEGPSARRAPAPPADDAHGVGAKQRILQTADHLFYDEGIRSVGIDRIISESKVSKASFYKHFGSKDTLITEYLNARHYHDEAQLERMSSGSTPHDAIREAIAIIIAEITAPGFRGDPWLNAAAEFSDPRHIVRKTITFHREWYTDAATDLLRAAGHPLPGDAADDLVLARDGAMTGGYAGDVISAVAALRRVMNRILAETVD